MSPHRRAFLIGMLGPTLQALGMAWDLLEHGVFARAALQEITLVHIVTGPAHLMMLTGFLVAVVSVPVALRVALASPEELRLAPEPPRPRDDRPRISLRTAEARDDGDRYRRPGRRDRHLNAAPRRSGRR